MSNKNDFVTKQQLADYSKYLINEIASTKKAAQTAMKKGNVSPKKMEQLLEYYEELNNVMPEFFTNDVIKVLERNANSLYWKNSIEDKLELAQEHVDNLNEFRKITEQSFKLKEKC